MATEHVIYFFLIYTRFFAFIRNYTPIFGKYFHGKNLGFTSNNLIIEYKLSTIPISLWYNRHETDLDLPRLPQRIKDSDKLWAEGAEPMNVMGYILFLIKKLWKVYILSG